MDPSERMLARIRSAIEESQTAEVKQSPSWGDVLSSSPLSMAMQRKTDAHYERDQRQKHLLDRLSEMNTTPDFLTALDDSGMRPQILKAIDRRDELDSPYWSRGYLASGQPIREGLDYVQAATSLPVNIGRSISSHAFPDAPASKNAESDLFANVNRLTGGLLNPNDPKQLAWEAERKYMENRPVDDLSFIGDSPMNQNRILPRLSSIPMDLSAQKGVMDGKRIATEVGVPEQYAHWAGLPYDVFMDPASGAGKIASLARAGRFLPAAANAVTELAIPGSITAFNDHMMRKSDAGRPLSR